jgi:non-canonical purine NTP pyrophosphatase (RdgB/HAM1 family)
MFTLVTSNKEKIHFAKLALDKEGIVFDVASLPLIEIQADTPQEIILHKADQAYLMLKKPVVVNDHWWSFPALGGFPGPYMHFMNDHLRADDLIRLMDGKEDRRAILTESICYKDDKHVKVFTQERIGEVLPSPQGDGVPGQQVISLSRDGLSIATHLNRGSDPISNDERKVWKELADWCLR